MTPRTHLDTAIALESHHDPRDWSDRTARLSRLSRLSWVAG